MAEINGMGKWCLGHGVAGQAESLRTGHYVEAPLVDACFSTSHAARGKGLAADLMPRCRLCRSIRQHHDHHHNATRRGGAFRRLHAYRWVKKHGHTIAHWFTEMDNGGVTGDAVTQMFLAQLGEPCPGLCAYEKDGVIHRHTIDSIKDMHPDVKNPTDPFTIENIGILCNSCNAAKRDTPWNVFIYARRCTLRMWQAAIDNPRYRRPEQGRLFS